MIAEDHPTPAELERERLEPWVEEHLADCPGCRVDRRMLLAEVGEPEGLDEARSALGDTLASLGDLLPLSWGSSRAASLAEASRAESIADQDVLLAEGTRVGPYRVEGLLGQGGMAVVYLVRHVDLSTTYALKLLRVSSRAIRERVRREAALQARLRHPNVLSLVEVLGVSGAPALVLTRVRGPSLDRLLREERLPIPAVDALANEILAGVDAAHRHGLAHRDLKPANVLVDIEADDRTLRARVSDFGLAKALSGDDGLLRTRTGAVLGTPSYMAPEQLRDASRVDQRADVFALGAMLFELLTGVRCFGGTDFIDISRRIVDGRRPDLATLRADVPERMVAALDAALQLDPGARPENAGALRRLWNAGEAPPLAWQDPSLAARLLDELEVRRLPPSKGPPAELETDEETSKGEAPRGLAPEDGPFVGRVEDLARLATMVGPGRLVTVTGAGGMGKTRLVQRLAWSRSRRFAGGVWFASAVLARSAEDLAVAVARTLDVVPAGDPVTQVGSVLGHKGPALLVLDNLEQVVDDARAVVDRWMAQAPELAVVTTSRTRLHCEGEQVLPLHSLSPEESASLLLQRARASRPGLELTEGDREQLAVLVRELDGLPLAIELAAARLRFVSLQSLVQRMSQRFRVLAGGSDRHATLRLVLEDSWSLLEPWEQAALAQLAVFEGGFAMDAAEAVVDLEAWPDAPWTLDVVQSLVDSSLVEARRSVSSPSSPLRTDLLVSVKAFAAEQLDASGLRAGAEQRHGEYFAGMGSAAARAGRRGREGAAGREALVVELDNLVAACRRAIARGDAEVAAGAVSATVEVVRDRGPVRVGLELAEAAFDLPDLRGEARFTVGRCLGTMQHAVGLSEAAAVTWGGVLDQAPNPVERAGVLGDLGTELVERGDRETGRGFLEEAMVLAERSGDLAAQAQARTDLAQLAFAESRLTDSLEELLKARELAERAGDDRLVLKNLAHEGLIRELLGHEDTCRAAFEQLLEQSRRMGDRLSEAAALHGLGTATIRAGRPEEALVVLRQARGLAADIGDATRTASATADLAWALADAGQLEASSEAYAEASELWDRMDRPSQRAVALRNHATVMCELDRMPEAVALLEEARRVSRDIGHVLGEAAVLTTLGDIARVEARFEDAEQLLRAALPLAEQSNAHLAASILGSLGSALSARGAYEDALDFLTRDIALREESGVQRAPARIQRAQVLGALGRWSEAWDDLKLADEQATSPAARVWVVGLQGWVASRVPGAGEIPSPLGLLGEASTDDDRALAEALDAAAVWAVDPEGADEQFRRAEASVREPLRRSEIRELARLVRGVGR